jgi:hypothetical protein
VRVCEHLHLYCVVRIKKEDGWREGGNLCVCFIDCTT